MISKLTFISILLTIVFTGTAFAGGSSSHDHGEKMQHKQHEHMTSGSGHAGHNEAVMDHAKEHQHGPEGSGVGQPADESAATQTIAVTTLDSMRYTFSPQPDLISGDIVKFVITNEGKIPHEFSIGDEKEQQAHREMMRKMPNMVHQDGSTVSVRPGETKVLTWKFKKGSEVMFACNVPGHFEAGMFQVMKIK